MDITIDRQRLIKALYLAQGIADRRSATSMLGNVLLRTEGSGAVSCRATDLRVSMFAEIEARVEKEGGANIGVKHLYEIVKNLPEEQVKLRQLDNYWLEIRAGKAHYKLLGISDVDFPTLPDYRETKLFEVDSKTLVDQIEKTIFAVSLDETRQHLSGTSFECDGTSARMVATDGHRLCKFDCDLGRAPKLEKGVIIPRKGLLEIRRLLEATEGTCEIAFSKGHLFVRSQDVVISVVLIDAQFPPYEQVLSQKNEKHVFIPRQPFLDALRRISILSSEKSHGIRFRLEEGQLTLVSDNPDLGEAQEQLDVRYKGKGMTIGFNARYVMDVVSHLSSPEILLELNGELDPGILRLEKSDAYVGVIMPMRI